MDNNTAKLLGIKDVIIKKVDSTDTNTQIYLELPRKIHKCPCCGCETDKIHDYRRQVVKDIRIGGKPVFLILKKRRYACPQCGKRFAEKNYFLPKYHRSTQRLILEIINAFRETVSATHIAREHGVSVSTALRYLDLVNYGKYQLPTVLSIDEFRGNAGGEKFQTILTDAKNHIILDVLPNRKSSDLTAYFLKFPRKQRLNVKYVVIDMSSLFFNVAQTCFPNAKIVADKYHVIRQVYWAMENVRKNMQKNLSPEWRKFCKRSRYLLNTSPDKLKDDDRQKLRIILGLSTNLEIAYDLKNDFTRLMHTNGSEQGRKLIADWLYHAENKNIKEFEACTRAVHNWSVEILNSLDCPYTNGFTEGCNNKTKVIKRVSFGVRKFSRFRNRILHCASHTPNNKR